MSHCERCAGHGLVKICYHDSDGFDVATCLCGAGRFWQQKGLLRAWVEQHKLAGVEIGRLEEFFTEAELAAPVLPPSRGFSKVGAR